MAKQVFIAMGQVSVVVVLWEIGKPASDKFVIEGNELGR
jgi:hypothetical protein